MTTYQTKIDLYLVARTQIRREFGVAFIQAALKQNGDFVRDRRASVVDDSARPFFDFIDRLGKTVVPSFHNNGTSQGYLGTQLVVFKHEIIANGATVKGVTYGAVFYGETESGEPVVLTVPGTIHIPGLLLLVERRSKHVCLEHMQGIEAWTSKDNALHALNSAVLEQVRKAKATLGNVDASDQGKAHNAIALAISGHIISDIFAINDTAARVQAEIARKNSKPTLTVNGVPVESAEEIAKKAAEEAAKQAALNDDISDCCTELTDSSDEDGDDEDDEDDEDDDQ